MGTDPAAAGAPVGDGLRHRPGRSRGRLGCRRWAPTPRGLHAGAFRLRFFFFFGRGRRPGVDDRRFDVDVRTGFGGPIVHAMGRVCVEGVFARFGIRVFGFEADCLAEHVAPGRGAVAVLGFHFPGAFLELRVDESHQLARDLQRCTPVGFGDESGAVVGFASRRRGRRRGKKGKARRHRHEHQQDGDRSPPVAPFIRRLVLGHSAPLRPCPTTRYGGRLE